MLCPLNRWRNIPTRSTFTAVFAVLVVIISSKAASATTNESASAPVHRDAANGPADVDLAIAKPAAGRSVLPNGWRRTTHGWERSEVWADSNSPAFGFRSGHGKSYQRRFAAVGGAPPQTLSQWMVWDRAREPLWANKLLGGIKLIHPLLAASFLIATAILITRLSESKPVNRDTSGSMNL